MKKIKGGNGNLVSITTQNSSSKNNGYSIAVNEHSLSHHRHHHPNGLSLNDNNGKRKNNTYVPLRPPNLLPISKKRLKISCLPWQPSTSAFLLHQHQHQQQQQQQQEDEELPRSEKRMEKEKKKAGMPESPPQIPASNSRVFPPSVSKKEFHEWPFHALFHPWPVPRRVIEARGGGGGGGGEGGGHFMNSERGLSIISPFLISPSAKWIEGLGRKKADQAALYLHSTSMATAMASGQSATSAPGASDRSYTVSKVNSVNALLTPTISPLPLTAEVAKGLPPFQLSNSPSPLMTPAVSSDGLNAVQCYHPSPVADAPSAPHESSSGSDWATSEEGEEEEGEDRWENKGRGKGEGGSKENEKENEGVCRADKNDQKEEDQFKSLHYYSARNDYTTVISTEESYIDGSKKKVNALKGRLRSERQTTVPKPSHRFPPEVDSSLSSRQDPNFRIHDSEGLLINPQPHLESSGKSGSSLVATWQDKAEGTTNEGNDAYSFNYSHAQHRNSEHSIHHSTIKSSSNINLFQPFHFPENISGNSYYNNHDSNNDINNNNGLLDYPFSGNYYNNASNHGNGNGNGSDNDNEAAMFTTMMMMMMMMSSSSSPDSSLFPFKGVEGERSEGARNIDNELDGIPDRNNNNNQESKGGSFEDSKIIAAAFDDDATVDADSAVDDNNNEDNEESDDDWSTSSDDQTSDVDNSDDKSNDDNDDDDDDNNNNNNSNDSTDSSANHSDDLSDPKEIEVDHNDSSSDDDSGSDWSDSEEQEVEQEVDQVVDQVVDQKLEQEVKNESSCLSLSSSSSSSSSSS
eukprot:CAMPEP_0175050768 /NCGR_PEP_ID=MMETSP0052_2-20121109/7435_1 /TAXON_ID=51329 ORGANISM="Polytomella parva, Strain SAG 63-3" /NCGR_SAMPLE_ID=MMETSP0052_2 /ASSEMBLY_ACC=CAM_ASM_000194 /LENGTH=801 /DNA_ID=CAMNT_0016314993 /DNA_START=559 /DNA_END=2961 /DNA_ORIENTATION=+